MADRRAELERKRAKLNAIREEKERMRTERERNSQLKSLASYFFVFWAFIFI